MDLATIFAPSSDNSRIPNCFPSLATNPSNGNPFHSPTSKAAIASLENIKVNSSFLEKDPISCCQICKIEFVLDLELKMLPCKHVYHSECILQWLETKNTCPVCQFQLPTEEDEDYDLQGLPRGENFIGTIIAEELLNGEEETEEDLMHFHDPRPPTPVSVMPRYRRLPRGENFISTIISEESLNDEEDLLPLDPPRPAAVRPNLTMMNDWLPGGENFIGEELLDDEYFMHFQDPLTPIVMMPNLTMMNDWWLDFTMVDHLRSQSSDTLALTSVSVSFSEIMNCLLISFHQLVMDTEFESMDLESVDLLVSMANIGENDYGVGVMANVNG
nr:hypothetical protein DM860_004406 [Ipomoea trifida]